MRLNLRRAREAQNLKIKVVSRDTHIEVKRIWAIEHYQVVPDFKEVIRLLKYYHYYWDEICAIIWQDIADHYHPHTSEEYINIHISLKMSNSSTEELERRFHDE